MSAKWKDVTTFSQRDKEKIPTTFTVSARGLHITVTCGHIHYKGEWIMHCRAAGIDSVPLGCGSLKMAKHLAKKMVKDRLDVYLKGLAEIED